MYTAYRVLFLALLLAFVLFPARLSQAQGDIGEAEFPALTGAYAVGKLDYHWIDEARDEIFTEDAEDQRELMVTVYYPAAPDATSQPAPYMLSPVLEITAQYAGVPQQFLEAMKPHGYASAPAADGRFPVLIFSPGFGNLTVYYTALLEEIASHGYIIAAMAHPYSANVVVFPDGRAVTINEAGADLENNRAAIFEVWVQDALFTLNQLTALDSEDDILAGHLDLYRIGMFGHSFGGAASAEVSYRDARVLASIDMDGTLFGEVFENGAVRPFMLMSSEAVESSDDELAQAGISREEFEGMIQEMLDSRRALLDRSKLAYHLTLQGSAHNTFTSDLLMLKKLLPMAVPDSQAGSIDPDRALTIIPAYVVAFFDQHVRGENSPLLETTADAFPEVKFEVYGE